jgi:hypothetical protein
MVAQFALLPHLGIERCGKIKAWDAFSASSTGMGVVAGLGAVMRLMRGPYTRNVRVPWKLNCFIFYKRLGPVEKFETGYIVCCGKTCYYGTGDSIVCGM